MALSDLDFVPSYRGYDEINAWERYYRGDRWEMGRLVYLTQRQGKELISDENKISSNRKTISSEVFRLDSGIVVSAHQLEGFPNRLVFSAYQVGTRFVEGGISAKKVQLQSSLDGHPAVSLAFAVTACSKSDCASLLAEPGRWPPLTDWFNQISLY